MPAKNVPMRLYAAHGAVGCGLQTTTNGAHDDCHIGSLNFGKLCVIPYLTQPAWFD
ncbi:MAG TPA: hypothetical protein VK133_00085 [Amoebophilaceae bacterium]|nr:hypothetical protein [Amoebophilaceae bacterium]